MRDAFIICGQKCGGVDVAAQCDLNSFWLMFDVVSVTSPAFLLIRPHLYIILYVRLSLGRVHASAVIAVAATSRRKNMFRSLFITMFRRERGGRV